MINKTTQDLSRSRGRYRTMTMKALREHANDPIWHDGERSKLTFFYPLPLTPWQAGRWTLKNWKKIAEHHMVDPLRAPLRLLEGIPETELYELGGFWCCQSPDSHISCFLHAIDFLVPDGTPVLAAQDGRIIELVDCNDEWGDEKDENGEYLHRDHLNFLTVHVGGMERIQYCHLAKGSVRTLGLEIGSLIKAGQLIGKVGKNGVTDRDHLHFIVFREDVAHENPFGIKSLIPQFRR